METWLKPNRRVLLVGVALSLTLTGVAIWLCQSGGSTRFWVGLGLLPPALLLSARLIRRTLHCRLGYRSGMLWVNLGPGKPILVPIDAVECFFLGSREVPVSGRLGLQSRAVSVVVRIAEKAARYHDRPVTPALGIWKEGYITILGRWCEPISPALIAQLNKRLLAAQRQTSENVVSK